MKRIALVLSIVLAFASLTGIVMGAPIAALNVSVGSEPETIDPALNSAVDGAIYIGHLFEGIYTYAPDGSLREHLDENPTVLLPQETQIKYVKQLCHGLQYLHDSKVAHRDFKSLNVLRCDLDPVDCDYVFS